MVRALLQTGEFAEVVSFTSRQPRAGEIHGIDYFFFHADVCQDLADRGECAEHIKFKENHYGITKYEIDSKMGEGKTPIVIVEPNGLAQLSKIYDVLPIYVDCDLVTLYTRFLNRFKQNDKADASYEAKRIASIYLEQTEWPGKVLDLGLAPFFTTYYEGKETQTIASIQEAVKHFKTK